MQKRQKVVPNPAISSVSVARRTTTEQLSERARIRAATIAQQHADAMRAPIAPAARHPDSLALRDMPDPLAALAWDAVRMDLGDSALDLWSRISTPLMFAVWSIGCFALGRLS